MLCDPRQTQVMADLGHANSNQGSTITGGCTQPTWWAHIQYPAWAIGGGCATGHYRTPSTVVHSAELRRRSGSTQYIETNTGKLPK